MKVDRQSGKLLGYVDAAGIHGMDARDNGDLVFGPGPNQTPQHYRAPARLVGLPSSRIKRDH